VKALASFYQSLSQAEREALVYILEHSSINYHAEQTDLTRRAIEDRRSRLRASLLPETKSEEEQLAYLRTLGIKPERGSLHDLASLLCQPRVAQALSRIAWFYGESPLELPDIECHEEILSAS
jgi:predicted DNA-binding protein YlxM (UPF0122 family)